MTRRRGWEIIRIGLPKAEAEERSRSRMAIKGVRMNIIRRGWQRRRMKEDHEGGKGERLKEEQEGWQRGEAEEKSRIADKGERLEILGRGYCKGERPEKEQQDWQKEDDEQEKLVQKEKRLVGEFATYWFL
jgi:hypothetical protein